MLPSPCISQPHFPSSPSPNAHRVPFPRVKNAAHAFRKIVREGGARGLWKGCVPNVQRSALVNLGDLTTYDSVKARLVRGTGLGDSHTTHFLSR